MDERQGRIEATRRYGVARMQFEAQGGELLLRLGRACADPMRVRILATLAERSMYGQELAQALEVSAPTISHHLALLKAAGLVRSQRENNYQHYELDTDGLQRAASSLTVEYLREIGAAADVPGSTAPSEEADRKLVLDAHFQDGRLLSLPGHSRADRFIMEKVAQSFEWGRIYDEKEINTILKTIYDDTATLRRKLVDLKLMTRENGRYWLTRPLH